MAAAVDDTKEQKEEFPHVGSVQIQLDFSISGDGQDEINQFGYHFNKNGQCLTLNTNQRPQKFDTKAQFEEFGALVEKYIFYLLQSHYHLIPMDLKFAKKKKGKKTKKIKTKMAKLYSPEIDELKFHPLALFASTDYKKNATLCVLIPGSGSVRAAQWSRSLCINDNLAVGSMFPFICAALKRHWALLLLDPNGRAPNGKREYLDIHLLKAYDQYIKPNLSNIENILIVCHSASGIATSRLLNERAEILPYIRGVAGTDVDFGRPKSNEVKEVYKKYVVNYRGSYQKIGTVLSHEEDHVLRVSAGHPKHEYTSASSFQMVFDFFDENLKK